MKRHLLVLICSIQLGCVAVGDKGLVSLGTDADEISATGTNWTYSSVKQDQSTATNKLTETVGTVLIADIVSGVYESVVNTENQVAGRTATQGQVTERAISKDAAGVEKARIAAEVQKAEIEAGGVIIP